MPASLTQTVLPRRDDWVGPLDGVRGLAALWVLVGHTVQMCRADVSVLNEPNYAVDVFMLVSGFLMTFHAIKRQEREPMERPRTWLAFWTRRFFRIAPLYYLLLIPALLLHGHYIEWRQEINQVMGVKGMTPVPAGLLSALLHFSFLFGLVPKYAQSMPIPDWSISLEMQFYAVFPFIVLLYRRLGNARATGILTVIWLLGHGLIRVGLKRTGIQYDGLALSAMLPNKLLQFLVGIVLARAFTAPRAGHERIFLTLIALLLAQLAGTGLFLPAATLITIMVVVGDAPGERFAGIGIVRAARGALASRPATLLADLSYGVYLVHLLLLCPLMLWFVGQPWFVRANPLLRSLTVLTIGTPLIFGVAWVLHQWVERPGISWGKRVVDRVLGKRATVRAATSPAALVAP